MEGKNLPARATKRSLKKKRSPLIFLAPNLATTIKIKIQVVKRVKERPKKSNSAEFVIDVKGLVNIKKSIYPTENTANGAGVSGNSVLRNINFIIIFEGILRKGVLYF